MKTKFTFFALMLCAALMVSCSKDNDGGGASSDETTTGEPAYMTVNLKVLGANATRATADLTATTAEAAVNNVRIYVFQKINTNHILEAVVDFDSSDAVALKKTFKITTGQKIIHALVNMSGNYPSATIGTTSLYQLKQSTLSLGTAITTAATDNAFWMTTLEDVNQTIVIATEAEANAGTNNITLSVGRAVAKIGVDLDPDTVTQPTDGLLSDVTYKVANNPDAMYALKVFNAAGYQLTPYYDTAYFTKGTDCFDNGIYLPTTTDAYGYHAAPSYMVENSHDTPTYGNSNVVMVRGTFTPNLLYNSDGTSYFDITTATGLADLETELGTSWDGTFWRIYNTDTTHYGTKFYYETPTVDALNNEEAAEYAQGTAYYGLWLKNSAKSTSTERYTVSRNQYWNVTITTIAGCGSNGEDDVITEPGKEEPIEEDTYMVAIIKVLDWEEVTQQGGI